MIGWFNAIAVLLLFAALLMELAAQSSKGINKDVSHLPHELSPIRSAISSDDLLLSVSSDDVLLSLSSWIINVLVLYKLFFQSECKFLLFVSDTFLLPFSLLSLLVKTFEQSG
jgi:AAA family ATP:ADP antiporter